MQKDCKMKICSEDWMDNADNNKLFKDLLSTIYAWECGVVKKHDISNLCLLNGYMFNWEDYSLEKLS